MNLTSFEKILTEQAVKHSSMEPQDAVKLCYQATFGAEHLLGDEACALQYFMNEYENVDWSEEELFEPICPAYSRGNLSAWKHFALPPDWLFKMFYRTACEPKPDTDGLLDQYLDAVGEIAQTGALPFNVTSWRMYRNQYEANGKGAVHHSEAYRKRERPAYRVVKRDYAKIGPILMEIIRILKEKKICILAIDGRAAAGKTTVAKLLADITGAETIHMDDFFLPKELRSPKRLEEIGGNIHYERFAEEVLPNLGKENGFTYRRFNCETMDYEEKLNTCGGSVRIVEGSYSCHPAFGEYMDLRIFSSVTPEEQLRRIVARNGPEMATVFSTRWIPMEERYFEAEQIQQKAKIRLEPV